MFYVRWKMGDTRRCRVFPPLTPEHPAYAMKCLYCHYELGGGFGGSTKPEAVQLIAVALVDPDSDALVKFAAGRVCNVGAVLLHERCVLQMTDKQLEEFVGELVHVPGQTQDAT